MHLDHREPPEKDPRCSAAGRDTGEPDKRQRAVTIGGNPSPPQTVQLHKDSCTAGRSQTTLTLLYGRPGEGAASAIEACAITVTAQ